MLLKIELDERGRDGTMKRMFTGWRNQRVAATDRKPRSWRRLQQCFLSLVWAAPFFCGQMSAAPERESFDFQEVYDLLKANLAGTTDQELKQAAVRGLLDQLAPKVSIVGEPTRSSSESATNTTITASVFERSFGYFRIARLVGESSARFQQSLNALRSTNTLKGIILDLRFASGQDYAAAVAMADLFLSAEMSLVDWGEGWRKSTAKTNAISLPVAVLVNRKTSGAAEVLAGILRHREVGLLLGTNTAGQASMAKEFSLKSGQRLRLAIAPVKVADGQELPFTGIKADIQVEVSPEDEIAWYGDAYKALAKPGRLASSSTNDLSTGTNLAPRRRMNEAELVRMSREGTLPDRDNPFTNAPGRVFEPAPPVVNDPALARALDLLKGLAVVQQFRSI
jgi:hypothetical protein